MLFLLLLISLSTSLSAYSQRHIEGIAKDFSGIPIDSANISHPNGQILTQTNLNGEFALTLSDSSMFLFISSPETDCEWAIRLRAEKHQTHNLRFSYPDCEEITITALANDEISANPLVPLNYVEMSQPQLLSSDNSSLNDPLNTIPGVKMEERGIGGSRRLSIRGSLLRSPFGVRNIKIYQDDLPLTHPDCSTPLEIFIPELIDRILIIKGPGGAGNGQGTGGTMQFYTASPPAQPFSSEIKASAGSFGYRRLWVQAGTNQFQTEKRPFYMGASYLFQESKGYREQEANFRHQLNLQAAMPLFKQKNGLRITSHYFTGKWELPGSLDSLTAFQDPTSAREYAVDHDAHVQRNRLRVNMLQALKLSEKWRLKSGFYANYTTKINPYGTTPFFSGYKDEVGQGFGGRSAFQYSGFRGMKASLSGEYQFDATRIAESENDLGAPGNLYADDLIHSSSALLGAEVLQPLGKRWTVLAAASTNFLRFDIRDEYQQDTIDYSTVQLYGPQLSGGLGIAHQFANNGNVFLNGKTGFSPPTIWEIANPGGSKNLQLMPETGQTIEIGTRSNLLKSTLQYELTFYHQRQQNAILPQVDSFGVATFQNSGLTHQQGAEFRLILQKSWLKSQKFAYKITASGALQRAIFQEFTPEGQDFSENRVPGIPFQTLALQTDLSWRSTYMLSHTTYYNGKTPLNNQNTHFQAGYFLTNLKFTWVPQFRQGKWDLRLSGGVKNLFNTRYSSFLQLNDARDRFYNPAQLRAFFVEIGWRL